MTIFITSGLAKQVGGSDEFLREAMNHMFGAFPTLHAREKEIQSLLAIVDRLPGPVTDDASSKKPESSPHHDSACGHEGVAVYVDSVNFDAELVPSVENVNATTPVVRFIVYGRTDSWSRTNYVEMPPANTLFVNGTESTMLRHRWGVNPFPHGPRLRLVSGPESLRSLDVFLPGRQYSIHLPLQVLTESREIAAGMGNIISRLRISPDTETISASSELERKVPEYLATKHAEKGKFGVFALVSPPRVDEKSKPEWKLDFSDTNLDKTSERHLRQALLNGAHLHRVTSGGGGWGSKQGLLSLDPAYSFTELRGSDFMGAMTNFRGDEADGSDMDVAKPGDHVQFFATYTPTRQQHSQDIATQAGEEVDTSQWENSRWTAGGSRQIVMGVIPTEDESVAPAPVDQQTRPKIFSLPHQFGMLSEGGACLRKYQRFRVSNDLDEEAGPVGRGEMRRQGLSKVDVPYAIMKCKVKHLVPPELRPPASNQSSEVTRLSSPKLGVRRDLQVPIRMIQNPAHNRPKGATRRFRKVIVHNTSPPSSGTKPLSDLSRHG